MKSVKTTVSAVAIIAIACALYEAWELRRAKESIAALTLDRERLIRHLNTRQSPSTAPQAGIPATTSKASDKAGAVPPGQFRFGSANNESLLRDPSYRKLQAHILS